jgi:transcription initiation factor TFIID subunit 13
MSKKVDKNPTEEETKHDSTEETGEVETRHQRKKRERKEKNKQERGEKKKKVDKKNYFTRDLKVMMYGFGDVKNPSSKSVELVEEMVLKYVSDITMRAYQCSGKRGRLQTDDFIKAVEHDPKKSFRAKELLRLSDVIKKSKKNFNADEGKLKDDGEEEIPENL